MPKLKQNYYGRPEFGQGLEVLDLALVLKSTDKILL